MIRGVTVACALAAVLGGIAPAAAEGEIPASLAPFEYLVGSWKGTGVPMANRLKGWPEAHRWAWKFAGGVPVAMTLTLEGNKDLARVELTYDPAAKLYRLDGTGPDGKPVAFAGALDPDGKLLRLDRVGASAGGGERLTIRLLPEGAVRYVIWVDRREPGAPRPARFAEIGLTKEGEAFAAGGSAADLPKCLLTGGAATMTVAYQGKSYPVCCTGCRDEFLENPEKYVKKALLRADEPARPTASPSVRKDDGAFGAVVDVPGRPSVKAGGEPKAAPEEPKDRPPAAPSPGPDPSARAATLLRSAQSLEKLGKTAPALDFYRQIVAKYPDTPQAKAAAGRIKALSR